MLIRAAEVLPTVLSRYVLDIARFLEVAGVALRSHRARLDRRRRGCGQKIRR